MSWNIEFTKYSREDYFKLDGSQKKIVDKILTRVAINPLPSTEGGYGKRLKNNPNSKLSGFLKIKLKKSGIRIIYKLEKIGEVMKIIIIGLRSDNEVYKEANNRIEEGHI